MNAAEDIGVHRASAYRNNAEHLEDELLWLDLLIRLRTRTLALQDEAKPEGQASRVVYITPTEVDWLLTHDASLKADDAAAADLRAQLSRLSTAIDRRIVSSLESGVFLSLVHLADLFNLSPFERDVIVICLAPELRRKYDRLYAYLQDDVTRKRPSVDLVLELLCDSEIQRWEARRVLSDGATLLRAGLIGKVDDPHSPSGSSGLAQFLRLDPRIGEFLLGGTQLDVRLAGVCQAFRPSPADLSEGDPVLAIAVWRLIEQHMASGGVDGSRLVLHLHGPRGVGKRELALHLCGRLNAALLCIDAELLLAKGTEGEALQRLAFREALLQQAFVYVDHCDALAPETGRVLANALHRTISEFGRLVFLGGQRPWEDKQAFATCHFHSTELPYPDVPARAAVWERCLAGHAAEAAEWAVQLSPQFKLTPGQIRGAVQLASTRCLMASPPRAIGVADLAAACREQSSHKLRELAARIEPHYGWNELVIPDDRTAHLREICNQVRHQHRVFGSWGFGRKLQHGKGLSILFSGQPGTGKTMAAQVLAADLDVDLYQVDLSGVVSKFIGETEKNLSRVFAEAETSNAILFFDEADALFGKRTAVTDAHDRYANIETSYLLQKMEEYEGVVILATNLRENMDDAFVRRIRFIVDFPFPDERSRQRIWESHFPAEAPVSPDVDCRRLARDFKVPGGTIKNIVLNAAFLAAADGGIIDTHHLLQGTRREFEKTGKLWTGQDLQPTEAMKEPR